MSIEERNIIFQSKSGNNTTIDYPVTLLKNVEDTADVKATPADNDYVPVIDSSDNSQMKKTLWSSIKSALSGVFAVKNHTHTKANITDFPASLPANGGNADMIDGLHANQIASNPNLLINPDFRINQRGQTEYTSTNCDGGYTLDRWALMSAYVIARSTGIKIVDSGFTKAGTEFAGNLVQPLPDEIVNLINGKPCTISAGASNGEVVSKTFVYNMSSSTETISVLGVDEKWGAGFYHWDSFRNNRPCAALYVKDASISIKWVKLELGSVATPFVPPDPATELLKCQRYYQTGIFLGPVFLQNKPANHFSTSYLDFNVKMYKKPTMTFSSGSNSGILYFSSTSGTKTTITPTPSTDTYTTSDGSMIFYAPPENVTPNGLDNVSFTYIADAEIY